MAEPHDYLEGRLRVGRAADPAGNPVEIVQQMGRTSA